MDPRSTAAQLYSPHRLRNHHSLVRSSLCLFSTASVEIIPLERVVSREDIDCPGDAIAFNCSILSNSEALLLTWRVTILGEMTINFTHDTTNINQTSLNEYITTSLTGFENDEFIQSVLEITLQAGMSDQIMVECSIGDLANASTIVDINASGT